MTGRTWGRDDGDTVEEVEAQEEVVGASSESGPDRNAISNESKEDGYAEERRPPGAGGLKRKQPARQSTQRSKKKKQATASGGDAAGSGESSRAGGLRQRMAVNYRV